MSGTNVQDIAAAPFSMTLANAMPQIVWTANPDGLLDYYNDQWVAYTGMTVEQTQGWGWAPVLHPDDLQRCVDVWKHCVETGEPYEIEYRFRRASDGIYRWHLGRALPVRDAEGTILKWFGTCTDIQHQKDDIDAVERTVIERTLALTEANARLETEITQRRTLSEKLHHDTARLTQIIDTQAELAKAGLELDAFFALVIVRLDALTQAAGVVLELIEGDELVYRATSGAAAEQRGLRLKLDSSLSGLSVKSGEVLHSRDTETDGRVNIDACRRMGIRSMLVAPLFDDHGAIGVLKIMGAQPDAFDEGHRQTLQLMAGLVGAAIGHQAAFEAKQRLLDDLAKTSEISSARDARTRAIIANAHNAFIAIDEGDVITEWNRQSETTFGWSRAEAIGQSMAELIIPERLRAAHHEGIRRYLASGGAIALNRRMEVQGLRRNRDEFPVELTLNNIKSGKRIEFFAFLRDITDRKEAEADILKLNGELDQRVIQRTAQLEAANRELEAFTYSVSHDLRAPLRGVDSFSRMVIEDYGPKLDDEGRRMLNVVRSESQRMGRLIDDLLAFSRVGRLEMRHQLIDMDALVLTVIGNLDLAPERRQQIRLMPLPNASGDRNLIQQVLVNLLSNALKFTTHQPAPDIEIGGLIGEGVVSYYIKDNGAGFDPRYSHKLFGVFQRLHAEEEFEGTGVGLALVQRIVHRHGGTVRAEGEVNGGATFCFSLPVAQEQA